MARVIIDANIGVALAAVQPQSENAVRHITFWQLHEVEIVVPALWWYEVVSGLRKIIVAKQMTTADAETQLAKLQRMGMTVVAPTTDVLRAALRWAERLKQTAAYDAQYLALAEQLTIDFWTADRALAHNSQQHGASWVKLLGVDSL